MALIALQPTTQSGEVVLRFDFGQRVQEVRTWLEPDLREWVLVGFAEGTLAHKRLSGNLEALKAAAPASSFDGIAWPSTPRARSRASTCSPPPTTAPSDGSRAGKALKQAVDPNQYYTLYADATQPQFDAASARSCT